MSLHVLLLRNLQMSYHLLDGFSVNTLNKDIFNNPHNFVLKLYTSIKEVNSSDPFWGIVADFKTLAKLSPTT